MFTGRLSAPRGHIVAVDDDLARGRRLETRQHAQKRGLAAARRAEKGEELAASDCEIDVIDCLDAAWKNLGDVPDLDDRRLVLQRRASFLSGFDLPLRNHADVPLPSEFSGFPAPVFLHAIRAKAVSLHWFLPQGKPDGAPRRWRQAWHAEKNPCRRRR